MSGDGRTMNRREALAALAALPAVPTIAVARLQSDDVLVVECAQPLSEADRRRIGESLHAVWPDHRVVVLDRGLRLSVLSEHEACRRP